jgi:thiol-disulfide isomerase/thioredoxin
MREHTTIGACSKVLEMRATSIIAVALLLAGCHGGEKAAEKLPDKAAETFAAIDAIKLPVQSPSTDMKIYQAKYEQAWQERTPLVMKAFKDYPDDPRTAKVMDDYWQSLMRQEMTREQCDAVIAQINGSREGSTNPELRQNAAFWSSFYSCYRDREDVTKVMEFAEGFSTEYPKDPRGATMFSFASMSGKATKDQMQRAFSVLVSRYSETEDGQFARSMLPLIENVGQKFDFAFKDAITGKSYSDESLRGKVLVIDWWATWCVPCIQSLPKMREIYAKYKGKGVEFVGISLDRPSKEGGLDALKEFLKKDPSLWPQHYAGDSPEFSQRYHVTSLPTIFVVDKDGTIVSIDGYRTLARTLENLVGKA